MIEAIYDAVNTAIIVWTISNVLLVVWNGYYKLDLLSTPLQAVLYSLVPAITTGVAVGILLISPAALLFVFAISVVILMSR